MHCIARAHTRLLPNRMKMHCIARAHTRLRITLGDLVSKVSGHQKEILKSLHNVPAFPATI
jgi:hypothetical protein